MTDVATGGRASRTRANAAESRKGSNAKESSGATKPGGAAFQGSANSSPFSPYKNSPAGRPSRAPAKLQEASISTNSTPPASQGTASPPVVVATPTPTPVAAPSPPTVPLPKQNPSNVPSPSDPIPPSPTKLVPIPVIVPRSAMPKIVNSAVVPTTVVVQPPIGKAELQETVVKSEPGSNNNSDEERSSANLSQLSGKPLGYVHGNEGRNRSPYKCNKCGKPKKGHVCTSVLVPQLIPMSLKPGVPGSAVVMTAVPTAASIPLASIPAGGIPKGPNGQLVRMEDTSFYTNWFEMAVSSLEFLRSSLTQHQFVGEVQTRLRGYRDSVKRADQQAKIRAIPSRMRIDASEAEAVDTLLRGLSEARDEKNTPQTAKRVRSSDRGDDTEQEDAALQPAKKPADSSSDAAAAAAALAGVSSTLIAAPAIIPASAVAFATATAGSAYNSTLSSAALSPSDSVLQGASTPRKRLLLVTSDDDAIPTSKSVRSGSISTERKSDSSPAPMEASVAKAVGIKSPASSKSVEKQKKIKEDKEEKKDMKNSTGTLHHSEDSDEGTAINSMSRAASLPTPSHSMLFSQPGSQPTASQQEELVKSMLALTPPASQEMPPPAPKLVSPTKRTWLGSDELLRVPPAAAQSSSQPLSQLSDIDFENAPEV